MYRTTLKTKLMKNSSGVWTRARSLPNDFFLNQSLDVGDWSRLCSQVPRCQNQVLFRKLFKLIRKAQKEPTAEPSEWSFPCGGSLPFFTKWEACVHYLLAFHELCCSPHVRHFVRLSLCLHDLKPTAHMTLCLIFHTLSFHHTYRLRGEGKYSPTEGCQCCLGDIVLYCRLSLTPAEFVWTRIWSISTLFFFYFFSPLVFLFCSVISQRWRSDTFDSSGPCGVNTEAIAPSLCLRVSTSISERLSLCLFTGRQTDRGREIGTEEDEVFRRDERVRLRVLLHIIRVNFIKTRSSRRFHEFHIFRWDDKKISINQSRGDNDFCEEQHREYKSASPPAAKLGKS